MAHHVAVIGAGPAGLMAAETLAANGIDVTVFDGRRSPGRKLLLAGRSGLNLTNTRPIDVFVDQIDDPTGFVAGAIEAFGPDALRDWCASLGQSTFAGTSGRVFPDAMRAAPLLRAWLARLDDQGVRLRTGHRWTGWSPSGALTFMTDQGVHELQADATVLALGGASWPLVGGGGEWVSILADQGVAVDPLRPSNAALHVDWSPVLLDRFEGTPIKNVATSLGDRTVRGDLMITDSGLEGTPAYSHAAAIGTDGTLLHLDLSPDRSLAELADHLRSKRRQGDSFSTWMRRTSLASIVGSLVREVTDNRPPSDVNELATLIKALPLPIAGVAGLDRAISTAGGVAMDGIDERFGLRALPGTFVAGEMLGVDAPTGGYLLQIAWSSGRAAALGALEWLRR